MKKTYDLPPIVWLKITGYMHPWIQYELGGGAMIKDQKVVCVQHLKGARDILMMETEEDMMEKRPPGNVMSGMRYNCMAAGVGLDPEVMQKDYGITKEILRLYVPVECPKMCLTKYGVLREWRLSIGMRKDQASAMIDLLRREFWAAVSRFNDEYARQQQGRKYAAREMIEEFCEQTHTPDLYVEEIRREWQRRVKRAKDIKD